MSDRSETLLRSLTAESAQEAWKEFYAHNWGTVVRCALRLGLSEHQAEDVLQETMVALLQMLPEIARRSDPRHLRPRLLPLVQRQVAVLRRRSRRVTEVPWETVADEAEIAASSEGRAALEAHACEGRQGALCAEALRRVREDPAIAQTTFGIFHAYVIERRPAAEVARTFGVTENGVYQIKNRLLRRLRHEIAALRRRGEIEFG